MVKETRSEQKILVHDHLGNVDRDR